MILEVDTELRDGRPGMPVLSARAVDRDVLWRRMEQMHEICSEVNLQIQNLIEMPLFPLEEI